MSSAAAARAEARRKAIQARGGERLAKLTTSARGEDATNTFMASDPPLAPLPDKSRGPGLREFVGEETPVPTPPRRVPSNSHTPSPFESAGFGSGGPDPSVWSEEQQRQLLAALMGGGAPFGAPPPTQGAGRLPPISGATSATSEAAPEDPLTALMAALGPANAGGQGPPFGFPPAPGFAQAAAPKPRTLLDKLMPIVHIIAAWIVLMYFMIWREPAAYSEKAVSSAAGGAATFWQRWAELAWKSPGDGWGVQFVPFFWAFMSLAIALHSWRIYSGLDPIQPPMLLSLALPHLPPPIPSVILNGMKYWQIGRVFLDDMAAVLVAVAFIVWLAGWFVD